MRLSALFSDLQQIHNCALCTQYYTLCDTKEGWLEHSLPSLLWVATTKKNVKKCFGITFLYYMIAEVFTNP